MKISIKIISLFLSVLMMVMAFPVAAFAAEKTEYVKEFRLSTASTDAAAKQWLIDNGYTVIGTNLNHNTRKDPVYLGYKTTYDPNEAITDMAVMFENGGYSFTEYETALKAQKADIEDMLSAFVVAIEEYVANYKAGKKNAVAAYNMMNRFVEDDSGLLLGDFLIKYVNDLSQLTKLFMQSNQMVLSYLYYMFALACTDYNMDSNWLQKFSEADPFGEYDPVEYTDLARDIYTAWKDIGSELAIAKKLFEYIAEYGSADEYREAVGEEQFAEDMSYMNLYTVIASYQYDRKNMVEYFLQDPNEIGVEDLYPLLSALTPGQLECVKNVGFKPLIEYAIMEEAEIENLADNFDKVLADKGITGTYSVYSNVDRSLFSAEGIALTSQALRESASTGESSWYKGNIDRGLEIALISIVGSTVALGLACVARAAVVVSRVQNVMAGFTAFAEQFSGWYSTAELAQFYGLPVNYQASAGIVTKIAAGVCFGIALISLAVLLALEYYNYTHKDYSPIPRIIVDHVLTDDDEYYLNYYCVRDQAGELGDLNAWSGQRWNALYFTTDKRAGDPIRADSISVKLKSNSPDDAATYSVHYFGETAAADMNRYTLKSTSPAIYMFFKRDHSLSLTASTFSTGTIAMFTGLGLLGGAAIGSISVFGANKLKKKKEASIQGKA